MTTLTLEEVFAKQLELANPHPGILYTNTEGPAPTSREEDIANIVAANAGIDLQTATEIVDSRIADFAKHAGQKRACYIKNISKPGHMHVQILKIWEDEIPTFCEKHEIDDSQSKPVSEKFNPYVREKTLI